MVDRSNRPVAGLPSARNLPTINFATGEAEALRQFAETTGKVSMYVQDRLDNEAELEARREGIKDGDSKKLDHDQLYAPTIRGRAYTQSALQAYQARLDLDVRKRMAQLEGQHRADPQGYEVAVAQYKKGLMTQILPEMQGQMSVGIDIMAEAGAGRLDKQALKVSQAAREAELAELEVAIEQSVATAAYDTLSQLPGVAKSAQRVVAVERSRLEAKYQSSFTDRNGNTIPLFSQDKAVEAMHEFDQMVLQQSLRGWFANEISDEDNGLGAVGAMATIAQGGGPEVIGQDGRPVAVWDQLTVENRDEVLSEMRSQISFMNAQQSHRMKLSEHNIKIYNRELERDFMSGTDGDRTLAYFRTLQDPNADPSLMRRMETWYKSEEDETDRAVLRETRFGIFDGTITEMQQIPDRGLSRADQGTLMNLLAAQEDRQHYSNSNDFKMARTMLQNFYKIPPGGIIGSSVTAQQLQGWYGSDFNLLIDHGESEGYEGDDAVSFVERARGMITAAKEDRQTAQDRLIEINTVAFPELDAKRDNNEITDLDYNREFDRLSRERSEILQMQRAFE